MILDEFSLIRKYFQRHALSRPDVALGIGDDAALCRCRPDHMLALAVDTLIEGVHFPAATAPYDIGYKALAVNLSDLAAMGAEPAWFTLALTCPQAQGAWLEAFSHGLAELAAAYQVALVGGDTTRGGLSITLQICGWVQEHLALRRDGARPGDRIYVTGTLGDAGLGLRIIQQKQTALSPMATTHARARLDRPSPRVHSGLALRGVASAAIDISDGLRADLGHILAASGVGATLELEHLPFSSALRELPSSLARELALGAGDDYELCFTVPPMREHLLAERVTECVYTCIGRIENKPGLRYSVQGSSVSLNEGNKGYKHF